MLFDCGEDAQRQLIRQSQIVHGRVNRIFVTSNSSANIYGIPGKFPVYLAVVLGVFFGFSQDLHEMSIWADVWGTYVYICVSGKAPVSYD